MDTRLRIVPQLPVDDCHSPIARTLRLLEQKWTLHIIRALVGGKRRFCQLQHALRQVDAAGQGRDVNPKTLSQRLKDLEAYGLVTRTIVSDTPPNVEYQLTRPGQDLVHVINSIDLWAERWMSEVPRQAFDRPDV